MGYIGQAVRYVTCDEGEESETTYRLECALWEDEQGRLAEDATIQDAGGYPLTDHAISQIPPYHAKTIEAAWDGIELDG